MACLEYVRSVRGSTILSLYFGLSTVLDLARSRTLFFIPGYNVVAPVHLASVVVKLVLFCLELVGKRKYFMPEWKDTSPEAATSFFGRVFFVWLNPLFLKGYKNPLTIESLPELDDGILEASRPTKLQEKWAKGNFLLFSVRWFS